MPLEEAMTKPNTHKKKTVLDQFLEQEFSIVQRDIAKENGISDEELRRRVLEGWSSDYYSQMYAEELKGWYTDTMKNQKEHGGKQTEIIWMNYLPPSAQMRLEDLYGTDR